MTKADNFCLKWNDFPDHLHTTFTGLISTAPLFSDVTLTCADGKQVPAHRLVLAGCSAVLKTILTSRVGTSGQHKPHLYLRGVSKDDLSALLTFMYQGEVSLPQDQLNSFLAVAEDLQVKGLVDAGKSDKQQQNTLSNSLSSSSVKMESSHQVKKFRPDLNTHSVPIKSVKSERLIVSNAYEPVLPKPIHDEVEHNPCNKYVISKVTEDEEYDNLENYGDGDLIQDQLSASTPSFSEKTWPNGRTEWTCSLCGKVFHHPGSTSQHMAVHEGRTTCTECGKVFNRVSDMRTHCRNVHQIYDLS